MSTLWIKLKRKYPPVKKLAGATKQIPRHALRLTSPARDVPGLLANSVPKSGTHLLTQILEALPGAHSYGSFLATSPSWTLRQRTPAQMMRRMRWIVPGEMIPGHVFYSPEYIDLLESRHVAVFFIYRDPRAIVLSEANYLTRMNRWHRAHGYFAKRLDNDFDRIMTSIRGIPENEVPFWFPDIAHRFEPFLGWLSDPRACAIRYEDLEGNPSDEVLERIIAHYARLSSRPFDRDELLARIRANMRPEASVTWSGNNRSHWRDKFKPEHIEAFKEVAGDLLVELGYEADHSW